jgi:hypothetical protein
MGEVGLGGLEAAAGMPFGTAFDFLAFVGQLDRVEERGQVGEGGGRVDPALPDVGPSRSEDVRHLLDVRGDLPRRVTEVTELEPLGRKAVEILDAVPRPVEVVQVDHQAGVGPLRLAEHVDRAGEVAHGCDRDELEVERHPIAGDQVGQPTEGVEIERAIWHPDARQHSSGTQLGPDGDLGLVDPRVQALDDPGQLDVVDRNPRVRQRGSGLGQQRRVGGQGVVIPGETMTDQPGG